MNPNFKDGVVPNLLGKSANSIHDLFKESATVGGNWQMFCYNNYFNTFCLNLSNNLIRLWETEVICTNAVNNNHACLHFSLKLIKHAAVFCILLCADWSFFYTQLTSRSLVVIQHPLLPTNGRHTLNATVVWRSSAPVSSLCIVSTPNHGNAWVYMVKIVPM